MAQNDDECCTEAKHCCAGDRQQDALEVIRAQKAWNEKRCCDENYNKDQCDTVFAIELTEIKLLLCLFAHDFPTPS